MNWPAHFRRVMNLEEEILERVSFDDYDIDVSHIKYGLYDPAPSYDTVFETTKKNSIVLRNKTTGKLERIRYTLSGYWPAALRPGYNELWGDIETKGKRHCVLFFEYNFNGDCIKVVVCFCAKSISFDAFKKLSKGTRYGAEVTAKFF